MAAPSTGRHCEKPLRRSNPDCIRGEILDCFAYARNDDGESVGLDQRSDTLRDDDGKTGRHCEKPLRRSNPDCIRGEILDCFAHARNDDGENVARRTRSDTRGWHPRCRSDRYGHLFRSDHPARDGYGRRAACASRPRAAGPPAEHRFDPGIRRSQSRVDSLTGSLYRYWKAIGS
jgi:hypothetical protein